MQDSENMKRAMAVHSISMVVRAKRESAILLFNLIGAYRSIKLEEL
jgi:hypothetical protein